jgi:uncharacterized protein (TIGR03435 family)
MVMAHGLERNQVFVPDALKDERYDITAKAPEGATPEQLKGMWQNLLTDRFHLVFHRETRVTTVWELTVAKNGSKMLDASLGKAEDPRAAPLPEQRQGGSLWLAPGQGPTKSYTRSEDGVTLISGRGARVSDLAFLLERGLRRPGVIQGLLDSTGLTGTYDFGIQFVSLSIEDNPNRKQTSVAGIFTAVEEYLGLKIEEAKRPIDVIVVDSADQTPTEN